MLFDAVRIRSDQRFQAGAHVSGGLDSGVVSALARKQYSSQSPFYGYSWTPSNLSSENTEFDERQFVEKTCELADITPVYVPMSFGEFIHYSKNVLKNQGYFQEDKIIEKIKSHKVNLIFSGWGGDEFISRGGHGIDWDLFFSLDWRRFFKKNPITRPKSLLGSIVFKFVFPYLCIFRVADRRTLAEEVRYLKDEFKAPHRDSLKKWYFTPSGRKSCLGMIYSYHLPRRTESWYVNGIANGLEYRFPLLDKRIVEYMLKVPTKLRINEDHSRVILREIARDLLPEDVRLRITKIDPVYLKFMDGNYIKAGRLSKEELNFFKKNTYLKCFDFKLIEKDLEHLKSHDNAELENKLYYDLFVIHTVHDFIMDYTK